MDIDGLSALLRRANRHLIRGERLEAEAAFDAVLCDEQVSDEDRAAALVLRASLTDDVEPSRAVGDLVEALGLVDGDSLLYGQGGLPAGTYVRSHIADTLAEQGELTLAYAFAVDALKRQTQSDQTGGLAHLLQVVLSLSESTRGMSSRVRELCWQGVNLCLAKQGKRPRRDSPLRDVIEELCAGGERSDG